jgi:hypothetical protein
MLAFILSRLSDMVAVRAFNKKNNRYEEVLCVVARDKTGTSMGLQPILKAMSMDEFDEFEDPKDNTRDFAGTSEVVQEIQQRSIELIREIAQQSLSGQTKAVPGPNKFVN